MKFILAFAAVAVSAINVEPLAYSPLPPLAAECVKIEGSESCFLKNGGGSPCACPTLYVAPANQCKK